MLLIPLPLHTQTWQIVGYIQILESGTQWKSIPGYPLKITMSIKTIIIIIIMMIKTMTTKIIVIIIIIQIINRSL